MDVLHDHRVRHPDIRLLVHQSMVTVSEKDWLLWFREQLLRRDLMRIRPVLHSRSAIYANPWPWPSPGLGFSRRRGAPLHRQRHQLRL
jgi:hypothetical protein